MSHEALFKRVRQSFERQGMMRHLGARLLRVEPGLCEVALPPEGAAVCLGRPCAD